MVREPKGSEQYKLDTTSTPKPGSKRPRWFFKETDLGLLVPTGLSFAGIFAPGAANEGRITNELHPILQYIRLTVGFKEIFGRESTIASVVDRLQQYTLERVVDVISRVTCVLNHDDFREQHKAQVLITNRLFGPERSKEIFRTIISRKDERSDWKTRALFHERQTLNLLKVAFLTLPVNENQAVEKDLSPLGEALLMMNDLIEPRDLNQDEELELYFFANALFNQGVSELSDFGRTYDLFVRDHPEVREYINLPERLKLATGLEPELVLFALQALHGVNFVKKPSEIDSGPAVVSHSQYFTKTLNISPEISNRMFALACHPVGKVKNRIKEKYQLEDLRSFDFEPFTNYPLVSFDDRAYCISIPNLRSLSGMSLQFRFLDKDIFTEDQRKEFLDFRGRLYEDYAKRLLLRTFNNRFIDGDILKQTAKSDKVCDGAVLYPNAVLLFEVKSALVPLRAKIAESYESYRAKKNKAFLESAEQLDATIRHSEEGKYIKYDINPRIIRRYIPITITMELLLAPLSYSQILDDIKTTGLLTGPKVAPLQTLDASEIEMIETAATCGRDVLELFNEKLSMPETQMMSFKNYCDYKRESWFNKHNPYLEECYKEEGDKLMEVGRRVAKPEYYQH